MDNEKSDDYYVQKIRKDLEFMVEHMKNVDKEELELNEMLVDSMMFRMIQVSENAKRLSESYKLEYEEVPWQAIYGLRNRIVHNYGGVELEVVYDTLKYDIPELLRILV